MKSRLDEWQQRSVTYVLVVAAIYGVLSLTPAPDYASAIAGTEPSFLGTSVGILFVMSRLLTIVIAPIAVLAVLLASTGTWFARRFAPSPRHDG